MRTRLAVVVSVIVAILLGFAVWHFSQPTYPPDSSHFIKVDDNWYRLHFEEDTTMDENRDRVHELLQVIELLPNHLIDPIGLMGIRISGAPDLCGHTWASGCASRDKPFIGIHETSIAEDYPWEWEHFATNGYTHLERVKILTHEFAHIIDFHVLSNELRLDFGNVRTLEPQSVTSYGDTKKSEDFADSLTFYVLWPDYLKAHYPERYAYMHEIFSGVEYEALDEMPSSIQSRLAYAWPLEK